MPKSKTKEQREEMAQKFRVIAESRMVKAISTIRLRGKLADKSRYEYDPDQIDQILSTLQAEVDKVKKKYHTPPSKTNEAGFKFKN